MSRIALVEQYRRLGRSLADELMCDGEWDRIKEQRDSVQRRISAIDEGQSADGYTCATCGDPLDDLGAMGICCPTCAIREEAYSASAAAKRAH